MSGKVTGKFLRHPDGPDLLAYRAVLVAVADLADERGGNARAAARLVAELSRVSVRYARTLLERAVEEGWLEVQRPGDRRRPTVFRFTAELWTNGATPGDWEDMGVTGARISDPGLMRGTRARISDPAGKVMRGASAHTCAPQERAQSAPQERASTSMTYTVSADPPPTAGGRAGAEGSPAVAAEDDAEGSDEAAEDDELLRLDVPERWTQIKSHIPRRARSDEPHRRPPNETYFYPPEPEPEPEPVPEPDDTPDPQGSP